MMHFFKMRINTQQGSEMERGGKEEKREREKDKRKGKGEKEEEKREA